MDVKISFRKTKKTVYAYRVLFMRSRFFSVSGVFPDDGITWRRQVQEYKDLALWVYSQRIMPLNYCKVPKDFFHRQGYWWFLSYSTKLMKNPYNCSLSAATTARPLPALLAKIFFTLRFSPKKYPISFCILLTYSYLWPSVESTFVR